MQSSRRRNACFLLAASLAAAACSVAGSGPRSTTAARRCADLPGAAVVLADARKRYFLFGELHGTTETPALFGDFVCAAARTGPVVVGLELQKDEQPSLDRYLISDGSREAREEILRARHWASNKDGRGSVAMFALVERLRVLRASGLPIEVVAFVPRVTDRSSQTPYEKAMAQQWLNSLVGKPKARFVGLVGNIHTLRAPRSSFEPAAMHMPQDAILTVGPAPMGGEAWVCQQDGCGPRSAGAARVKLSRGMMMPSADSEGPLRYDRWYSVGAPMTASPPVSGSRQGQERP